MTCLFQHNKKNNNSSGLSINQLGPNVTFLCSQSRNSHGIVLQIVITFCSSVSPPVHENQKVVHVQNKHPDSDLSSHHNRLFSIFLISTSYHEYLTQTHICTHVNNRRVIKKIIYTVISPKCGPILLLFRSTNLFPEAFSCGNIILFILTQTSEYIWYHMRSASTVLENNIIFL